jgi:hypothetical protein
LRRAAAGDQNAGPGFSVFWLMVLAIIILDECRPPLTGGEVRFLENLDAGSQWQARKALLRGAIRTVCTRRMGESTPASPVGIAYSGHG